MALHPTVKWAQRKQNLFITLSLRDIINQKVILKDNILDFQCQSNKNQYQFKVEFLQEIDQDKSQWNKTGFQMIFILAKKDTTKPYWPRLTKQNKKSQYIQCDWDKWIDQDQEEQQGHKGLGNVDYDNMNNFHDSDDQEQSPSQNKKQGSLDDLDQDQQVEENKH